MRNIFYLFMSLVLASVAFADQEFFDSLNKNQQKFEQQYKLDAEEIIKKSGQKIKAQQQAVDAIKSASKANKYQGDFAEVIGTELPEAQDPKAQYAGDDLLIFVSSSVPTNSLISLALQARKSGALLVFNGFIENSFKKTVRFIHDLNKDGVRAIIEPHAFIAFSVEQVPTFVAIAEGNNCNLKVCTPLHDKISGNVTLNYALRNIAADGEFGVSTAKKYLKTLEG